MGNYLNRVYETYTRMSAPKKAGIWFVVCSFLQKGISLVTVPIFTRIMPAEQYGVFSVYQSWYSIIEIFATLKLWGGVFNNGMLDFEQERDRFVSGVQGLSTIITILIFCIYFVFQEWWNQFFGLSSGLMYAMFVELLFAPAFLLWCAYQRFQFKYVKMVTITLLMSVLAPVLGIVAVLLSSRKAEARILSFVMVQVLVGFFFYILNIRKGKVFCAWDIIKYALKFNIPLLPHYLSSIILTSSDRIMINNMVGTDKAAVYSVVYNISAIVNLVIVAISNSFMPYAYQNIKNRTYTNIKKNINGLIVLMAAFCALLMLLGPEVIAFFAPEEYYEALWIIPPVIAASFFMFLYPMFNFIEFYFKKNLYVMVASCLGAVLNIVLNYWMIPGYGYMAAGYTTLFCYVLFSISHYFVMRMIVKRERINRKEIYNERFIFCISAAVLLIMLLTLYLYQRNMIRYSFICAGMLCLFFERRKIVSILRTK